MNRTYKIFALVVAFLLILPTLTRFIVPQRLVRFLVAVAVIFLATPALAVEFQPLGLESASVGGAGAASARGSCAPYYNPALLAERIYGMEISVSGGVGIREVNIAESINRLAQIGR